MDKLPYGEDVNYWQTSQSSPDKWMEKTKKQIRTLGGQVLMEGFGSEPATGRSAYMMAFEIEEDQFKVIWPVLPSKRGNEIASRRQAATMLYHDIKAKWVRTQIYDRNLRNNGNFTYRVGLGISIDEIHRARTEPPREMYKGIFEELEYPLIDLRLSRSDCQRLIADAGLPVPFPSACYFCPFHTDAEWHRLRQYRPDLFFDAVEIEKRVQWKRKEYWYKDKMWMHRKLIPLDKAIPDQPFLFDLDNMDNCESGYCFT